MNIPSASDMSEKLIREHPELFPGNYIDTKLAIMEVMKEYENACNKYVHRETYKIPENLKTDLFEHIANIVRTDAKIRLGIDLDKPLPRTPTDDESL